MRKGSSLASPSGRVPQNEVAPPWVWRFSLLFVAATAIGIVTVLFSALMGLSDVVPSGLPAVEQGIGDDFGAWVLNAPGDAAIWDSRERQLTLTEAETQAVLLSPFTVTTPSTILINLTQIEGPLEAGYGLWWGNVNDGSYAVVGLNSNGYVTVQLIRDSERRALRDWQVFPHVKPQTQVNQIQVDLSGDTASVWVNDEFVIAFDWAGPRSFHSGAYAETFSAGVTTIRIERFAIWGGPLP